MALWLALSDVATREEHQELKTWVASAAARPDRLLYRQRLHDNEGAWEVFEEDMERDRLDDEFSEPEIVPM